jgi:hypothetical protein
VAQNYTSFPGIHRQFFFSQRNTSDGGHTHLFKSWRCPVGEA